MNSEVTMRAHGRVNLIGEHTDYNGGWVLPTTISQYTEVRLEKTGGQKVIISSTKNRQQEYELGNENIPIAGWIIFKGPQNLLRKKILTFPVLGPIFNQRFLRVADYLPVRPWK